tara:strand:+ start:253 stop:510 length:258 start_codon:yes stop_codon:yes gene_type:complete
VHLFLNQAYLLPLSATLAGLRQAFKAALLYKFGPQLAILATANARVAASPTLPAWARRAGHLVKDGLAQRQQFSRSHAAKIEHNI